MEFPLKQRLIGAAVIIALAVVIIPMLLKGSGHKGVQEIPPPPQPNAAVTNGAVREESVPLPPADSSGQVVEAPAVPESAAPATSESASPAESTPESAATPAPTTTPAPVATGTPAASTPPPAAAPAAPAAATEPQAWVVQVGSFGEESKAMALRDRLRKDKFNAFVERYASADHHTMFRVRVGPELERTRAEALQKRLAEQEKLKGFVTHHP